MKRKNLFALLLSSLLFFGFIKTCAAETLNRDLSLLRKPYQLSLSKNFSARKYILGPNDVISISVYDSPELDQKSIRVQPDGKITLMLLGPLFVSGITLDDLNDILIDKYKKYFNNPEITLNLEKTKPFVVYVSGAVLNPGSYELDTDTAKATYNLKPEIIIERKAPLLSNILVAAGGISFDADLENVKISNDLDGTEFSVNLLEILDNGSSSQDIYLMAGDHITIPKLPTPLAVNEEKYKKFASATFSPKQIPVKVYGYVNNPGLIKLDTAQSLNLNSAITAAGGYLSNSAYAPKKVFISRADTSGKLVTRSVNPMSNDAILLPNDIVYVPEKARPLIGKGFDYLTRIISPASTFASAYNGWSLMLNPHRYQINW